MTRVVAIALERGDAFIDAVRRVWDAGDAVFPVDMRLPDAELRKVIEAVRPTHLFDGTETVSVERGLPAEDGDAIVITTSGSTSYAKGVVLTQDAVAHSVAATNRAIDANSDSDRWLLCIPTAHMGGLGVVARSILTDTPIDTVHPFDAARVEAAAKQGATLTAMVPAALRRIDPSGFRKILLGGASVPSERPDNVVATYGLTETCGGVVYDGRPLEQVEIRLVEGQIHIKSPTLLRRYRSGNDPKVEGWLPTGDMGSITDGVLTVEGRVDELINTGGEKVWPSRVEEALAMHPKIFDVAVTGRPDAEWTEAVTAVVVPIDRSDPPTIDDLRRCVKDVLPAFMAPKRVEYVDEIPRSGLGKIKRHEL